MSSLIRRLIFCILVCVVSSTAVAADYLGSLREATTAIEVGAYNQAGTAIEQALAANESDPLVHLTLAILYLHVGKLDDGAREFREVIALSPSSWQAHYGLAVAALLKGDKSVAQKEIAAARDLSSSDPDVMALELYAAHISGGSASAGSVTTPLAKQVLACIALKGRERQTAKDLLIEVLRTPSPPGFEENRSPVATFSPSAPIAIPHGKLTWSPPKRESAPEVSGIVHLNADTSRSDGVEFVTFYVDGSFVGMSNSEPYSFNWNTTSRSNGLHQIRIDGKDKQGSVISTKSTWVRIRNENSPGIPPVSGPDVDNLIGRLWDCIRLSECRRLAHYELAKVYLADGNKDAAIPQLEYALAFRPDFSDAKKVLDNLRSRPMECREIKSGSVGMKRVALTFDDGPNERTSILLEVLAGLKVPATFFLVGFRSESQPELVKAIQAGGHDIQNHSYSHPNLSTLSTYEIEQQLCKTNAVIRSITGRSPRYFRPPGGNFSGTVKKAAAKHGMCGVFWTLNCGPYEGGDAHALADFVVKGIGDGGIVLMHNGEPATVNALPIIVEKLQAQGYQFVTVSHLLGTN